MAWNGNERRNAQSRGKNMGRRMKDRPDEQQSAANWYPFQQETSMASDYFATVDSSTSDTSSVPDSSSTSDYSGGGGSFDGGGSSGDW